MTKTIILASMMVLSIVLILGLSDNAFATMYLKIEGISGESVDTVGGHGGEIDVLAWSWGMPQSGGGVDKVSVQDLSIVKMVDRASPQLYGALSGGETFPEAILSIRAAVEPGLPSLDYLVITLEDVRITSVSVGASSDDDRPTETITLNFAKVKIVGNPLIGTMNFEYSLKVIEENIVNVESAISKESTVSSPEIPSWIKQNASWWAEGSIDDNSFKLGIQYMIKEKIITITDLPAASGMSEEKIPDWVKQNARWWADGAIDDDSFVNGLKYMVQKGIINVT